MLTNNFNIRDRQHFFLYPIEPKINIIIFYKTAVFFWKFRKRKPKSFGGYAAAHGSGIFIVKIQNRVILQILPLENIFFGSRVVVNVTISVQMVRVNIGKNREMRTQFSIFQT